jgi:hypothetical protein
MVDDAGLGIDVGGMTAKLGVVSSGGQIHGRTSVPTGFELTADALIERLATAARPLLEQSHASDIDVRTAGLALPGMLSPDRSAVRNVTNLPGLNHVPLRDRLAERLGLAVALDNDACAAALGEYRYGAGRGAERLLVVTVGTGIGAGMVVDGAVFRTSQGCLGDPGHVIVAPDGPRCGCGGRGCMEVMAAAPAFVPPATHRSPRHRAPRRGRRPRRAPRLRGRRSLARPGPRLPRPHPQPRPHSDRRRRRRRRRPPPRAPPHRPSRLHHAVPHAEPGRGTGGAHHRCRHPGRGGGGPHGVMALDESGRSADLPAC